MVSLVGMIRALFTLPDTYIFRSKKIDTLQFFFFGGL